MIKEEEMIPKSAALALARAVLECAAQEVELMLTYSVSDDIFQERAAAEIRSLIQEYYE